MNKLKHYSLNLLMLVIVAVIVVTFLPITSIVVLLSTYMGIVVAAVSVFILYHKHKQGLCELCVSAMPLNPSEKAEKYAFRFKVVHLFENKRLALLFLVGTVVVSLYAMTVIGAILMGLILLSYIYAIMAAITHTKYQPWCPSCRGGGSEVAEDSPLPELTRV